LLVIANMIGTGVFTTLGLQAAAVPDAPALLLLWLLGGIVALCGALSYAELAAALPDSGGEYHFISRIYGPRLGTIAGWLSLIVGFGAPVALAAMACGRYLAVALPLPPLWLALGAVTLVAAIHALDLDLGRRFQVIATLLKLALILLLILAGMLMPPVPGALPLQPSRATLSAIASAPFALAVIYVSYAYSGWNAATYVSAEVRRPRQTVPRALALGTALVTLLYLLLNLSFLRQIPAGELPGTVEVGAAAAVRLFGVAGSQLVSVALGMLLISSLSAMLLAGPRVLDRMAEDWPGLRPFSARNRRGAPFRAVLSLWLLASAMILTDSFAAVLGAAGFTLGLSALLTVVGVMRLRRQEPALPRPYRIPWYPLPPLLFALVSVLSLGVVATAQPLPVGAGLALLFFLWLGLAIFDRRAAR